MRPYELNAGFDPIKYVHKLNMNGLRDGNSKHLARVANQSQRGRARQILKRQLFQLQRLDNPLNTFTVETTDNITPIPTMKPFVVRGIQIAKTEKSTYRAIAPSSLGTILVHEGSLEECIIAVQNFVAPDADDKPIYDMMGFVHSLPVEIIGVSLKKFDGESMELYRTETGWTFDPTKAMFRNDA